MMRTCTRALVSPPYLCSLVEELLFWYAHNEEQHNVTESLRKVEDLCSETHNNEEEQHGVMEIVTIVKVEG